MTSNEIIFKGKQLSKEQEAFNKKIEAINKLKADLESLQEKLPKALALFTSSIAPLMEELEKLEIEKILAIDKAVSSVKVKKSDEEKINEYFEFILADNYLNGKHYKSELDEIFSRRFNKSIQEHIEEEKAAAKAMAEKMMKEQYNVDLDIDFDKSFEEFQAELNEKINEANEETLNEETDSFKNRFKNKADIKQEEKEKEKLELSKKTIRDIYIQLIKAFHPDTETDIELKAEKETISKKITEAYGNNDLYTLIKLEIEYLTQTSERFDKLPQDSIKLYSEILTKQKKDLEFEISKLKFQKKDLIRGMCQKNSKPETYINNAKLDLIDDIAVIKEDIEFMLENYNNKSNQQKAFKFALNEIETTLGDIKMEMFMSSMMGGMDFNS